MIYVILVVIFFIWFYRAIVRDSHVAYILYRYSGFLTIIFFGAFAFSFFSRIESGSKQASISFLVLAAVTHIVWYSKACTSLVKGERKGFFWGIAKAIAYITGYGFLGKRMYQEFEVKKRLTK